MTAPAIRPIDEYPIPLTQEGIEELQRENPTFSETDREEPLSVDEVHEEYVEVIATEGDWEAHRVHIYGGEGTIYLWNHQAGRGYSMNDNPAVITLIGGLLLELFNRDG